MGTDKPGLVDADGSIRDLSGIIEDIRVETITALSATGPATPPNAAGKRIGKIFLRAGHVMTHAVDKPRRQQQTIAPFVPEALS